VRFGCFCAFAVKLFDKNPPTVEWLAAAYYYYNEFRGGGVGYNR